MRRCRPESLLNEGQFCGTILSQLRTSSFLVSKTQHRANFETPPHAHENAYLCLVLRGSYTERCGRDELLCQPATISFHPRNVEHSEQIGDSTVESINVEFSDGFFQQLGSRGEVLKSPFVMSADSLSSIACRIEGECLAPDECSALILEGLILELVGHLQRRSRLPRQRMAWLDEVKDYLAVRFSHTYSLRQLAKKFSLHPVYLASAFRSQVGCSVGDYVRNLRIQYVREQIVSTTQTLAEIASDAGFSDQSHMTRTFKRHVGMTPLRYRQLKSGPE